MTNSAIRDAHQREDDVQGFAPISCEAAMGLAIVYLANNTILGELGNPTGQVYWAGQAMSIMNGSCGPLKQLGCP